MDLEKRVEVLEKKLAELEGRVQAKLDFKEITMESNIKTPYKMLKACDIEELQRDALKKHKRNTANTISELIDRVVRLEKKEAESYIKIQVIPELYLSIEDCKNKIIKLIEDEKYRIR